MKLYLRLSALLPPSKKFCTALKLLFSHLILRRILQWRL
jgi:hypothetical protein